MRNREILISGGGTAGCALAYFLREHGFRPTVVERATGPRTGGQAVDIRGAALSVVDRMGLLPEVRAAATDMRGMSYLDARGRELVRLTELTLTGGVTGGPDVEVMREDLVTLLHRAAGEGVEYLFDDSIAGLSELDDEAGPGGGAGGGVRVEFAGGTSRRFDLVIGADGLHSRVRRLSFGAESGHLHHLGAYISVCSAPNLLGLDHWQLFHLPPGRLVGVYSARGNRESRIMFGFQDGPLDYDYRDADAQRRLIADRFEGVGWRTPELLEAMWRSPEFYFDSMSQVRMSRWSRGRVALVGDAGYGPSPLSGQGTSVALVGAYVLAGELAQAGGEYPRAFASYQHRMARYVRLNQELALRPARRGHTRAANWRAIQLLRLLKLLPARRALIERAMRPLRHAAEGIELPDYRPVSTRSMAPAAAPATHDQGEK